jgi:beta-lactamase class D
LNLKILFPLAFLFSSLFFVSCNKTPDKRGYEADFSEFFRNDSGSFVLYDFNNKYNIFYREAEANKEYSPAETYKYITILSNLINSRNDSLGSSAGVNEQKKLIKNYAYGNNDTSFSSNGYVCGDVLKISALEQVNFLKKVYSNEINISKEQLGAFKAYFISDTVNQRSVSFVTGECNDGMKLNWCIGTVEYGTNLYIFALNLVNSSEARAKEITESILYRFRIIEPDKAN